MVLGFELIHHRFQLSILADNKSGAQDTVKLATHEFFWPPRPIFVCRGMVLIAQ